MATVKERMQRGELYNAEDPELAQERAKAKEICWQANRLPISEQDARTELLRQILGSTDGDFTIMPDFWCDYGYNIHLGKNFYANHGLVVLDCAPVTIGDNVFIAPNVGLYTAGHPLDVRQRNRYLEYAKPITIGDNVWIGGGVQVMPGVTIGACSVVAGGSVVVKDVPAGTLVGGNPARVIRALTAEEIKTEDD